jgi:GntR family transcriptional regulator
MVSEIAIDFRSGEPIFTQIVNQVQRMVADGELQQGDQLPTVRQLAADLGVNFNTVARAYRILDEAGLISTQRGRGTYIWEQPDEETVRHLRRQGLDDLMSRAVHEMQRLGYEADEVETTFNKHIDLWRTDNLLDK